LLLFLLLLPLGLFGALLGLLGLLKCQWYMLLSGLGLLVGVFSLLLALVEIVPPCILPPLSSPSSSPPLRWCVILLLPLLLLCGGVALLLLQLLLQHGMLELAA
jgi:hypothetical protein